jgi:hypothetical protein
MMQLTRKVGSCVAGRLQSRGHFDRIAIKKAKAMVESTVAHNRQPMSRRLSYDTQTRVVACFMSELADHTAAEFASNLHQG